MQHVSMHGMGVRGTSVVIMHGMGSHGTSTYVLLSVPGVTIGWLPQEPPLPDGLSILEAVLASESQVGLLKNAHAPTSHARAMLTAEACGAKHIHGMQVSLLGV